ncbi:MAG: hypothetical protein ABI539_01200 [Acidobacteriota bacterium]
MIDLSAKVTQRPPSADKIVRNINFGLATGLTKTAKEGQSAVLGSLKGTFTLRGSWSSPSNKFGIKIKPAKRDDLTAEVRTNADWLLLHEEGGLKRPSGHRLAIPTENVRRNKRLIIPKAQRPAALRGKRTFIIHTSRGDVLFQRKFRGKRSMIVALFNLEPQAKIKKQSTFYEPIGKVVKRRLAKNLDAGIRNALATMK